MSGVRSSATEAVRVLCGDARRVLADLDVEDPAGVVVVTDPVWPNVPAGMFDVEDPARLFRDVARHFPRLARRAVVHLGCTSDPRFLVGMPRRMPFVRVCWLRYACPSYLGTVLGSGDVAYVYGSNEGPEGKTVLPGECTSNDPHGKEVTEHPCPRKIEQGRTADPDSYFMQCIAFVRRNPGASVAEVHEAIGAGREPNLTRASLYELVRRKRLFSLEQRYRGPNRTHAVRNSRRFYAEPPHAPRVAEGGQPT